MGVPRTEDEARIIGTAQQTERFRNGGELSACGRDGRDPVSRCGRDARDPVLKHRASA